MRARVRISFPGTTAPKKYVGWRCLHVAEGGYLSDNGMPEIRPGWRNVDRRAEALAVKMTSGIQWLSYNINFHNTYYTKSRWRAVHTFQRAFTNQNGFGDPTDPRVDYVNGRDYGEEEPKLMKALICGGMFIRGDVDGAWLVCRPGFHAVDAGTVLPSVEEVMEKNWYFVATNQLNGNVSNFPQGGGKHVRMPYILREATSYPLRWFTRWEEDYLPDPLKIYLPQDGIDYGPVPR